jgi:uncharacterized membrane protein YeaQ/YmgE (transglycosylase-associated protein family)
VLAAAGPNWLGSPQHVVVGAIRAFAVSALARSRTLGLPEGAAFARLVGGILGAAIAVVLVPRFLKGR